MTGEEIAAAVAAEREECARLCDDRAKGWEDIAKAHELPGKHRNVVAAQRSYVRAEELRKAAVSIRGRA